MEIDNALQTIGLNDKETQVYIALLQLGQTSAYGVATKSGLKKPTTYVVLEELMKKGLVRKIPRKRKALYVAKSPEEVFALAEERLETAKKALPELLALKTGEQKKIRALYFEGIHGVIQTSQYGLKEVKGKEIVGFYAYNSKKIPKELVEYFNEYNIKLKKWGISPRVVAPDHPSLNVFRQTDKEYGREVRTIPFEEYSSEASIEVVGNMVRIMDLVNLQGMVVDNSVVAKAMKEVFEMVWSKAYIPPTVLEDDTSSKESEVIHK